VGYHVGAKDPVNGQFRSYGGRFSGVSTHQPGSNGGAGVGTYPGPRLAVRMAMASFGVGAGVDGSTTQLTTVSTMRQRLDGMVKIVVRFVLTHYRKSGPTIWWTVLADSVPLAARVFVVQM
jgi:hypothetical protein